MKVSSKPTVLVSLFCWQSIGLSTYDFSCQRKHIAQECLPTCRGGSRECSPCHQHFHPVHYNKCGFAVINNFSSRKNKQFPLRLLLIPHYEIMIRGLPGVCQPNSCWSRWVGTTQCCNVLAISFLKIKSIIIGSMSRCQSAEDQSVLAGCLNLMIFMSARPLGCWCESVFLEPTYPDSSSVLGGKVCVLQ